MSLYSPEELARGHSSRWVRFIIRTLSIRGLTWFLFALGLLATGIVCQQASRGRQDAAKTRFEADSMILQNTMLERLHRYAQTLQGVRGLLAASRDVEKAEFRDYVASIQTGIHDPGIVALGFIEKIDLAERKDFISKSILEHDASFKIHPPGDRPDYFVVRFVEPLAPNIAALGFDVGSEPARREAAESARDSGRAVLTRKIELIQAVGKPGAILLDPVYSGGAVPPTIDERRTRLQGWVYVAFVVDDMMAVVRQLANSPLQYEIFDGAGPSARNLLCGTSANVPESTPGELDQCSTLVTFGRPWTLRTHSPSGSSYEPGMLPVGILAAGGICMSLLIVGTAQSMATTSSRACSLAAGMTGELRQQEEALRASEERLAMVIKGSNDGIWDWNVLTNEVYFSPRWKAMLGYEEHEIENNFASWEKLLHPDDAENARREVSAYFEGKLPTYQLEHRLRHKDGGYRWILARGVAARDPGGRPVRMAGSHVDLTELKRAEHDLRMTNQELQDSQTRLQATLADLEASHKKLEQTQLELIQAAKLESVGTLAAGVAHEVKNPLQIIIMGLDFLDHRLQAEDHTTRATLADMRDAALRADSITRELLHFSSASEFNPCPADLESVLDRSLWLLRTDITKSGVTVVKHLAGNLPKVAIDTPKIQQVLINLIINALQAMDRSGTLTLTTACGRIERLLPADCRNACPLQHEESSVVLRLHDTGPGIPENQLMRIFDPFFTTKAVGLGTGLGLSVVRKIIDLHGGFIHFRNSPRGGLEVTLAFAATAQPPTIPAEPVLMTQA